MILVGGVENHNKKVVERLSVLEMVVENWLFYDIFLKVVFKKHVNYNENVAVRNIRRKSPLSSTP